MEKMEFAPPESENIKGEATARKEYKKPSLTEYGDIAELTRAGISGKDKDGFGKSGPTAPIRRTPTPIG